MKRADLVVLITGAASGVGAATTALAIGRGWRVVACDVNAAALRAVCDRLGAAAVPLALDVREPAEWERALDAAGERFGRVDVLVNNAGLVHVGWMHELSIEQLRHMVDVNLLGLMYGVHAVVPRFLAQGHGHVVNVGSLAGFVPMPGQATYAATKHAVRAFHHGVALELRRTPVTFSLVCPAAIDTPMLHQQIGSDAATLSFADPVLSVPEVARAVVRAIDAKPCEILLPATRGALLRIAGVFPGLLRRMIDGAEARGRRVLERRQRAAPGKETP